MKNSFVYVAVCLIMLSLSFSFNETGVQWFWRDMIEVPIILSSTSIILIGTYLVKKSRNTVANIGYTQRYPFVVLL